MHFYQIKIVIKRYKTDEFVKSMHSFSRKIRKEKGCLGCSVYRDSEKENTFSVIGKWRTRQAMQKHFKTQNFEVLIGAARVLGETFEMNIADSVVNEFEDEEDVTRINKFINKGNLRQHTFSHDELTEILDYRNRYSSRLSIPDCSCIYLSRNLSATLLTGDRPSYN